MAKFWNAWIVYKTQHNRARNFWRNDDGFNLVELSIALAVIGLLLGVILKGQDLLESARLKSIVAQGNQYRLAVTTFRDRYDAMPGDFAQAQQMLAPDVPNGNGNALIEGEGLAPQGEPMAFWAHLAAAGLIPSPGHAGEDGAGFGHGAPACKLGGGFTVCSNPSEDMPGHWLCVGKQSGQKGTAALLTPQQAQSMMKGDGHSLANTGSIQARDGSDVPSGSCVKADGYLNVANKKPACVLYIQL